MPDDGTRTVVVALGAGIGITLAKVGAAVFTGSTALAAEAAHSLADTANDLSLFIAQRRSNRPADDRHLLGYGREGYFWALVRGIESGMKHEAQEVYRAATPHAVDLLEADLEAGVLLLEHIEPGTKVSDEPQIPPVNEVAELLTGLRETANYDAGQLPTMAEGMESMFSRIGGLLSNPQMSAVVARQVLDDGYHRARELAGNGPKGLLHGDLHLSNILRAGPGRGLVAIDPRPSVGDLTFDAIDWTLDRVTSIAEIHERVERLSKLVPDLDPDRLWGWCQATAAALAIHQLRRRPPDATTHILLGTAASSRAL
jgi:streptomycin 6-kinase